MMYDDDDAMQADVEDLLIVMEARSEHEKGLDFVLEGGRERGPIIVSSVTPGMFFHSRCRGRYLRILFWGPCG